MWGMTGEISPGTGAGPGDRPELRVSYEDRDRAVELLRVAAGDGRLTAAELDERVEAALTARTSGELAALTADLPAVPGQAGAVAAQAKDVVRLDYEGGNATRRGQWVIPARMEIRAVGRQAEICGPARQWNALSCRDEGVLADLVPRPAGLQSPVSLRDA
jgi:hypothetical protein